MGILRDWKLALAKSIGLAAEVKQDVTEIKQEVAEIRALMAEQELLAAGWETLSVNKQLKLESAMEELGMIVRELNAHFNNGQFLKPVEIKDADTIAQLAAEVKGLSDVIHQHAQLPIPKK